MTGKPVDLGISRLKPEDVQEPEHMETPAAPTEPAPPAGAAAVDLSPEQIKDLEQRIVDVLHTCFDPEIPVNIYELGLIYDIIIKPDGFVNLLMTLTTPACPVAGSLPGEVQRKVLQVPGVTRAQVDLVWDPPWDKARMSEAAKLQLGIDDW
jgi:FeS assembly SUF system protein